MQTPPAAIGLTCKDALEVFSQNETLRLQARVTELELHAYMLQRPSLHECMKDFNNKTGPCFCICCIVGREAKETDRRYQAWAASRMARGLSRNEMCEFKPRWEAYLESIGASMGKEPLRRKAVFDTLGDWVYSGYGANLRSMNSPRKAVWDRIKEDYGPYQGRNRHDMYLKEDCDCGAGTDSDSCCGCESGKCTCDESE
jgi:hypothetical protein